MKLKIKFKTEYKIVGDKAVIAIITPYFTGGFNKILHVIFNRTKGPFVGKAFFKDGDTNDVEKAKKIAYDKAERYFWKLYSNSAKEYYSMISKNMEDIEKIYEEALLRETAMNSRVIKLTQS